MSAHHQVSKLDAIRVRIADWHVLGHQLSTEVREEPKLLTEICSTCLHFRDDCTCPDMVRVSKRTVAIQAVEKLSRQLAAALADANFQTVDKQALLSDAERINELAREALGA